MKYLKPALFWTIGITFFTIGLLKYLNLDTMSQSIFNHARYPHWFFDAVASAEFLVVFFLMTANATKKTGGVFWLLLSCGERWAPTFCFTGIADISLSRASFLPLQF